MANDPVSIRLLDREFLVACSDQERPGLLAAARLLDERMRELRAASTGPGFDRVAVLVALEIANEFLTLKQQNDSHQRGVETELAALRRSIESNLGEPDPRP